MTLHGHGQEGGSDAERESHSSAGDVDEQVNFGARVDERQGRGEVRLYPTGGH